MTKTRRSLLLSILFFFLGIITPLMIASTSISSPLTQSNISELIEQGKKSYQQGNYQHSAEIWQQLVEKFATNGDSLNQSMALSNLALSYQQLGEQQEAKKAIATSLNLLQTRAKNPEQMRLLASALNIQGQQQLAEGETQNALNTWQQATEIYRQLNNPEGEKQTLINQAQAMQDLGLYPRACQTLLKALLFNQSECEITPQTLTLIPRKPTSLTLLGLHSLGNVLRVLGKTEQAQQVLLTAAQLAQQQQDLQNLAGLYLSLGNTKGAIANRRLQQFPYSSELVTSSPSLNCLDTNINTVADIYQQALSCYQEAESSPSIITRTQAQLNRLSLLVQLQQKTQIGPLLSQLQTNLAHLPLSRTAIYAHLNLAQTLICLQTTPENPKSASPLLQQCPTIPKKIQPLATASSFSLASWDDIEQLVTAALKGAKILEDKQGEAHAKGYLGAISWQKGQPTQAQHLTEEALQLASAFKAPEIAYLWQWQLGRIYQNQGNSQKAIEAYTIAYDILQSLRGDLVALNPDVQFTFRDSVEPIYRELVSLLLDSPSPSQPHLQQARNIIETLQLAQLNNFFREACIVTKPQQIDQIDADAAIIYSIILPQRLAIIVALAHQPLVYYSIPVTEQQIEQTVDNLFSVLSPFIFNSDPLRPQQHLYNWLIRPAEPTLKQSSIKTLVFVLDGILRSVPVAALHDGKQYLVENYSLALTPGLQLLESQFKPNKHLRTLAAGLATARLGFSSLPAVEKEIKSIAQSVPTHILFNQDFTRSRLQKQLEITTFPVVHLATHGQFSSVPENTFILAWDGPINVNDFHQLLQSGNNSDRSPIELLILSACQTAAGDKYAALGLAGVAVRSGARSTLATLWSVQDQSTALLMTRFYSILLEQKVTKAEALRQAQLSLLHSSVFAHPYYWASFVLLGNWL